MNEVGGEIEVGVVHPNLSKGGSGAVCLNVLEALQHQYQVTLVTDTQPDFSRLNEFFGTNVRAVDVRTVPVAGELLDQVSRVVSIVSSVGFDRLRKAVLTRWVARTHQQFDVIFSTKNELSLQRETIQYIHAPKWERTAVPGLIGSDSLVQPLYDRFCNWVAGFEPDEIRSSTLLSNSEWTARLVEDVYGIRPDVVYPPVNTDGFDPRPWSERETGFVLIGRIAPNKNIEQAIDIVSELHQEYPDVHLHLVGPTSHPRHREAIQERISGLDFVCFEGELPRQELLELVSTHRFGLHTRPHEYFGIAVAELVASGAVPFVPGTGAPREIVGERPELLFESTTDAVETIRQTLENPSLQRKLVDGLPDIEERFGRKRFQETIRTVVASELNER